MTPAEIIRIARGVYNDEDSSMYRISEPLALAYVNEAVRATSALAMQYFITSGNYACTANSTEQMVTFADAQAIVDVIRVRFGNAVTPMDITAMNAFSPDWHTAPPAQARNWARFANDPLRFYLYPPAPALQQLEVLYLRIPKTYTINEVIDDLPASLAPALADYVIFRAESRDDEHTVNQRAQAHYAAFVQKITGAAPGG